MSDQSRQLRGWKDIAAYLHTSERTAKRWEQIRGLPIRRVGGSARELVFAVPEELDEWIRARTSEGPGGPSSGRSPAEGDRQPEKPEGDSSRPVSPNLPERPPLPWRLPIRIAAVLLVVLAAVAAARWLPSISSGRPGGGPAGPPAPGEPPLIYFTLTIPERAPVVVGVKEGGCLTFAPPALPEISLCGRRAGRFVFAELRRTDSPSDQPPMGLRLDPDSTVTVANPYPLLIEWTTGPHSVSAVGGQVRK